MFLTDQEYVKDFESSVFDEKLWLEKGDDFHKVYLQNSFVFVSPKFDHETEKPNSIHSELFILTIPHWSIISNCT